MNNLPPVVIENGFKYFKVNGRFCHALRINDELFYARDFGIHDGKLYYEPTEPNEYEFIKMLEKQNG